MAAEGLSAVEISAGQGASSVRPALPDDPEAVYFRQEAAAAKKAAGIPVMLVGGVSRLETAEDIVGSGDADIISLARPLIREPDLVARWQRGDTGAGEVHPLQQVPGGRLHAARLRMPAGGGASTGRPPPNSSRPSHRSNPMSTVQTVKGPLDSSQLGRTLAHEHIITGSGGMEHYPFFHRDDAIEWAIEALAQVKLDGIDSLVDVTTVDLGRQIDLVMRVAEKSEVNIVVATGVYRWVPPPLWGFDADALAELFVREIEDGIEGTGVRAGIIKIAWDEEALPPEMRKMRFEPIARAAARAVEEDGRAGILPHAGVSSLR